MVKFETILRFLSHKSGMSLSGWMNAIFLCIYRKALIHSESNKESRTRGFMTPYSCSGFYGKRRCKTGTRLRNTGANLYSTKPFAFTTMRRRFIAKPKKQSASYRNVVVYHQVRLLCLNNVSKLNLLSHDIG